MKLFRIISHPYLLIASFLLILISGRSWGGFYGWYLAIALSHGSLHAIVGIAGVILLALSRSWLSREGLVIQAAISLIGVFVLWLSLVIFFKGDKEGYNDSTFEEVVPFMSLTLFGVLSLLFLARTLLPPFKKNRTQPI